DNHYPFFLFFFFSSRRRHTRSKRDWSSDVCSSDLEFGFAGGVARVTMVDLRQSILLLSATVHCDAGHTARVAKLTARQYTRRLRSEERRVGKECTTRRGR